MSKKPLHSIGITLTIIVLFVLASFTPIIGGYSEKTNQIDTDIEDVYEPKENVLATCRTFGFPGKQTNEIFMSINEAEILLNKIEKLQIEIARDPRSERTYQLQNEIIDLANEYNLLPEDLSAKMLKSRLHPSWIPENHRLGFLPTLQNKASEWMCNFASTGSGSSFPVIIFPRLIPILLTPIPRVFLRWSAFEGVTSCGGLLSGKGFIASGQQKGFALGFWGLGFSVFLPPLMAYGLIGYALYASVEAEEIEYWPPNNPPVIDAISPPDGAENVPISTSELKFYIEDFNADLMNYTVTTNPDIGSGSGSLVSDGEYSVPISGLEGTEEYTWTVVANDGEDEVEEIFTFTTEPVAPMVYDPLPEDGERYVAVDLSQLSFKLKDLQGDPMDYTVETSPDIGSGSGVGVGDGTYTVDVSGLEHTTEYTWYVNVTDGTHWKHKVFSFQVEHKMVFDPFDGGWEYRKQITIDHTKVEGDLTNFPVLINTADTDLRDKAQEDGDDILFMDGTGIATRLYHEIEYYDGSTGELIAWVNVTNLPSDHDTIIYIYYGNPNSDNQQAPERAWDSHFVMVQHLNEASGIHYDSTLNDFDGMNHGTDQNAVGKIDGANDFNNGERDYIESVDSIDLDYNTVSAWVYPTSNGGSDWFKRAIVSHWHHNSNNNQFKSWMLAWSDGRPRYGISIDGSRADGKAECSDYFELDKWHYIVGVYDGSNLAIFVDGSVQDTELIQGTLHSSNVDYVISSYYNNGGIHGDSSTYFDGKIDEVRISSIVRNAEWISTEYKNQNNPLGFLSFGPEETDP